MPLLNAEPAGLRLESVREFVGALVSTFAMFDVAELPTFPTLSVSCSRYS